MDLSHLAVIDLRLAIERAAADLFDFPLNEALFRLAQAHAEKMPVGELNPEVIATNNGDLLRGYGFVTGERPKAGCDGAFVKLRLRERRRAMEAGCKSCCYQTKKTHHHYPGRCAALNAAAAKLSASHGYTLQALLSESTCDHCFACSSSSFPTGLPFSKITARYAFTRPALTSECPPVDPISVLSAKYSARRDKIADEVAGLTGLGVPLYRFSPGGRRGTMALAIISCTTSPF